MNIKNTLSPDRLILFWRLEDKFIQTIRRLQRLDQNSYSDRNYIVCFTYIGKWFYDCGPFPYQNVYNLEVCHWWILRRAYQEAAARQGAALQSVLELISAEEEHQD